MSELLGGQIGLDDFIFAHRKGLYIVIEAIGPPSNGARTDRIRSASPIAHSYVRSFSNAHLGRECERDSYCSRIEFAESPMTCGISVAHCHCSARGLGTSARLLFQTDTAC